MSPQFEKLVKVMIATSSIDSQGHAHIVKLPRMRFLSLLKVLTKTAAFSGEDSQF